MKIPNVHNNPPYWDIPRKNKPPFPWYKKGKWKKILRKQWIRKRLKDDT
jgi:hypothetical protein